MPNTDETDLVPPAKRGKWTLSIDWNFGDGSPSPTAYRLKQMLKKRKFKADGTSKSKLPFMNNDLGAAEAASVIKEVLESMDKKRGRPQHVYRMDLSLVLNVDSVNRVH